MSHNAELIQALALTAEACGTPLSDAAKRLVLSDLSAYEPRAVIAALGRCRRELKGRLSLSEILARLDDGRPGAEEAWAMLPFDESATVVWTEEMATAWGVALPLILDGDRIAARMAFRESYTAAVMRARDARRAVCWVASLGQDVAGRETAVLDAVAKGRISADRAHALLPYHVPSPGWVSLLTKAENEIGRLTMRGEDS